MLDMAPNYRSIKASNMKIDVTNFPVVRLNKASPENQNLDWLDGLAFDRNYAILGEVGSIDHYIILDISTGNIMPGMWHKERFELVPEEEL